MRGNREKPVGGVLDLQRFASKPGEAPKILEEALATIEKLEAKSRDAKRQIDFLLRVIQRAGRLLADGEKIQAQTLLIAGFFLEQAERDGLTGLFNRRGFNNLLESYRKIGIGGSLVLMDIDKFKLINDIYGHLVGDRVLVRVGEYLRKECRPTDAIGLIEKERENFVQEGSKQDSRKRTEGGKAPKAFRDLDAEDIVGRVGGEEILVFFPNATPEQVYKKFVDMHQKQDKEAKDEDIARLNIKFIFPDNDDERSTNLREIGLNIRNHISFSGAIIEWNPGQEEDIAEALKMTLEKADAELYAIKESGRNQLRIVQNQPTTESL